MKRQLAPVADDFANAELGDRRLVARLALMGEALASRPDQPLPDVLLTEAGLEAGYRFLKNERVTPAAILKPHIESTVARSRIADRLLVLHDTTTFHFNGRGFGPLRGADRGEGFYAHVALAIDGDVGRTPLGVLGVRTFERAQRPKGQRKTKVERRADNELHQWSALFDDVQDSLGDTRAVHVMDRQADSFALFAAMAGRADFVIRGTHDRIVTPDKQRVGDVLADLPVVLERTVQISSRKGAGWNRKRHQPVREDREAILHVTAGTISLPRPDSNAAPRTSTPENVELNVVRILEVNAPEGEAPIEWLLWTTLPINRAEDVAVVVDIYRARWVIEELFKAIKTGCAYEQRRLESSHGLLNLLALTIPVACRLLLLRSLARQTPDAPAAAVLSPSQLAVLAATPRAALPVEPTARDALWAVARLGGHLRRNGEPGWQVLTRGYHELLVLEEGWLAASNSRGEM
jgi:hypothetical protein